MEKEAILNKTKEALTPLETGNIVKFATSMSVKSLMENPLVIVLILVIFFYAVIKRSKFVLSFLFAIVSTFLLIRFTLQGSAGEELSLASTLPFAIGGLLIGAALIYFIFIKSE